VSFENEFALVVIVYHRLWNNCFFKKSIIIMIRQGRKQNPIKCSIKNGRRHKKRLKSKNE
jgi:hypothetical protein